VRFSSAYHELLIETPGSYPLAYRCPLIAASHYTHLLFDVQLHFLLFVFPFIVNFWSLFLSLFFFTRFEFCLRLMNSWHCMLRALSPHIHSSFITALRCTALHCSDCRYRLCSPDVFSEATREILSFLSVPSSAGPSGASDSGVESSALSYMLEL
jgi:hypothetical protein